MGGLSPWKINGWNISSWRFGSDHFPFYSWLISRFKMLIFQGVGFCSPWSFWRNGLSVCLTFFVMFFFFESFFHFIFLHGFLDAFWIFSLKIRFLHFLLKFFPHWFCWYFFSTVFVDGWFFFWKRSKLNGNIYGNLLSDVTMWWFHSSFWTFLLRGKWSNYNLEPFCPLFWELNPS